ncbi:DUF3995 domain-containing protein [Streptomyces sp. ISL-100]|uniref:DUF3995 domain-containing protein n=1 Tax=Streptomyces sp. ISL-100 TaxID=2819173 RepID=UPI001BE87BFE|nr:DUF3995 domain-containing protein [Streptomyces sp. ISL-100]MBT2399833.1 DUF3995 domain-containing protein [Streptomyces sp. ISL-100]
MINVASLLLAAALFTVGVLHFLWAVGVYWPATSQEDLARKAIPDSEEIPTLLTALVAALLVGAAYVALAANWDGLRFVPDWLYAMGIWGLVAVMALRGLVEPFTTSKGNELYNRLNRRVYAPFCVVLALLGVVVAVG